MPDATRDCLDDEEFVFVPTSWDLAFAIGIRVDPDRDLGALDDLADAMLVSMNDGPELERLTRTAMDDVWTEDLEAMTREGLRSLVQDEEWGSSAAAALAELDRDARDAEISKEVVRHLALDLSEHDLPLLFCLHCLEEHVRNTPAGGRRALALQAAVVTRRNAAVPRNRLAAHVARLGRDRRDELGTSDRRLAVRRRLGRIGRLGRDTIPALAAELEALAAEHLPVDPEDDDVWQSVLSVLLAEVAMPELN